MDRRTMLGSVGAVIGATIAAQPLAAEKKQERSIGIGVPRTLEETCLYYCEKGSQGYAYFGEMLLMQILEDKANAADYLTLHHVLLECSSLCGLVMSACARKSPLRRALARTCAEACKVSADICARIGPKEYKKPTQTSLLECAEACLEFAATLKA